MSTGSAGTVRAAMRRGLPMIVMPLIADQALNAERVAHAGAGVVIPAPPEAGAAVQAVLADSGCRVSAGRVVEQIDRMASADHVVKTLAQRMTSQR